MLKKAMPEKSKILRYSIQTLIIIFGYFFFVSSFAQETPATENTLQKIDTDLNNNAAKVYDFLDHQLYRAVSEQQSAIRNMSSAVVNGLTGMKGVAANTNSVAEQNFRNWTPTAQDLANMVEQGLQTGSLADRLTYYNKKFPVPRLEELTPGKPNSILGNYGVFSAVSTNAALGVADKGFDNVANIMGQIDFLYEQIDRQTTLKAATDLNSAILLKIAALQADLIRLQSQQLKMQAVSQLGGNSERAFMAKFVQDVR